MAGGENAAAVACWECAERADRFREGMETDWYRCSSCRHEFGIDFEYSGPPDAALWPPTTEERARILQSALMAVRDRVIEKLVALVQPRPSQISPETELGQLSPSLVLIRQWVSDLQAAFGVRLPREALRGVDTVGALALLIAKATRPE